MIRFRSSATGNVDMLDVHGMQLLTLMGKTDASLGVITPAQMDDAIQRLQAAAHDELEQRDAVQSELEAADNDDLPESVGVAQRAFPLLEMLRRCKVANQPILWSH